MHRQSAEGLKLLHQRAQKSDWVAVVPILRQRLQTPCRLAEGLKSLRQRAQMLRWMAEVLQPPRRKAQKSRSLVEVPILVCQTALM